MCRPEPRLYAPANGYIEAPNPGHDPGPLRSTSSAEHALCSPNMAQSCPGIGLERGENTMEKGGDQSGDDTIFDLF